MTAPRVFVTYHVVDVTHQDDQFAIRLIKDLHVAGVDVVAEETAIQNGSFVQYLNEVLPTCQWLILVQTPDALHSQKVQMAVNTALTLVVQQRMRGVLPVIAVPCKPQEVPVTWATLKTYDATQDYQRALTRVLLTLDLNPALSGKQSVVAPPPSRVSSSSSTIDKPVGLQGGSNLPGTPDSSSTVDRPEGLKPLIASFEKTNSIQGSQPARENQPDMPIPLSSSPRQRRHLWLIALSVTIMLVLIIASVAIASKPFAISPNPTATTTTTAIADLNASATANANATATVDANLTSTARAANATATARADATAQANATATALARANATAQANVNATATAVALADPYRPFSGKLALNDPLSNNGRGYEWEEVPLNSNGGSCQFIGNAYLATAPQNSYRPCHSTTLQGSNFTFEVRMQIITGDCGGISLRDTVAKAYAYYFMVCQDGTYAFYRYDGFTAPVQTLRSGSSTAIITGLKQSNLVAMVANGSNFDLYVNHQKIDSVSDSTYSQGQFGVSADANTTAAYTFARMWTL